MWVWQKDYRWKKGGNEEECEMWVRRVECIINIVSSGNCELKFNLDFFYTNMLCENIICIFIIIELYFLNKFTSDMRKCLAYWCSDLRNSHALVPLSMSSEFWLFRVVIAPAFPTSPSITAAPRVKITTQNLLILSVHIGIYY